MRPLTVAGVAAVAAGLFAALDRGIAAAVSPTSAVVTLLGVLGLAQGVRYVNARRDRRQLLTDPGEPERRAPATVPGSALDERIAQVASPAPGGYQSRRDLRGRVREAAVVAVARDRNCAREAAAEAVDDGTWTDDPAAAAFFDTRTGYPVRVRLVAGVRGRSNYWYGLRAAIDELERIDGGEP